MPQKLLLITIAFLSFHTLSAQKVLQVEKYGSAKTRKIYIGEVMTYRLIEDKHFTTAYLEDIRVEDGLLQMGEYYVKIEDIAELRYERSFVRGTSKIISGFGLAWSFWALVGTTFDGNDSTKYRPQDAIITATAVGSGFIFSKLFRYQRIKIGKRKRLRLLDLRFKKEDWED